jgi:uncharacterized protein (TIGR03382 family)
MLIAPLVPSLASAAPRGGGSWIAAGVLAVAQGTRRRRGRRRSGLRRG